MNVQQGFHLLHYLAMPFKLPTSMFMFLEAPTVLSFHTTPQMILNFGQTSVFKSNIITRFSLWWFGRGLSTEPANLLLQASKTVSNINPFCVTHPAISGLLQPQEPRCDRLAIVPTF